MSSAANVAVTTENAIQYIGQTVLVEIAFDELPEPYWRCYHVVGVVFPLEGICEQACFMAIGINDPSPFPIEVFFEDIRTLWAMRHRDRQSSGNVLGRIAYPALARSGAALPAHRNGSTVAMNGSTGEAHP